MSRKAKIGNVPGAWAEIDEVIAEMGSTQRRRVREAKVFIKAMAVAFERAMFEWLCRPLPSNRLMQRFVRVT